MQGAQAHREYRRGLLLVAGSAVAWSTAGFYARAVEADVWTTLFWRCAFAGLLILSWCAYSTCARFMADLRALGRPGLLVAACIAVGTMSFIAALNLTSVADVLIIQATAPFVAAFLGWAWLKERLEVAVLVASTLAFVGIAIMVAGSYGHGSIAGDLLAIATTAALGLAIVLMRRWKHVSMMPAVFVAFLMAVVASAPLAEPWAVSGPDFFWLAMFGLSQTGLGWVLLTLGARLVPAAETALLGVLEVVLAPVWVWLAFNEIPSAATLVGGALVLRAHSEKI
jgi:drug/metabolite transporter (DMT)-like permease